jgi:hypothetical protein
MVLPTEVDQRLAALEMEVKALREEMAAFKKSLGG